MDSILPFILATNSPFIPIQSSSSSSSSSSTTTNTTTKNWSNLPINILFGLIKYLDILTDIPHLRSVCSSWHSALPLSLLPSLGTAFDALPSLNLPHKNNNINNQPVFLRFSHFYLLSNTDKCDTNTNNPWIVKFMQVGDKRFHLFNPLNLDRYLITTPKLRAEVSLLGTKSLQLSSPLTLVVGGENPLDLKNGRIVSKKVVGGWNFQTRIPFNMLVLLEKEFGGGLLFMRLGDLEWINIDDDIDNTTELDVVDVVFYNNEFYAFEVSTWKVGIIDVDYEFGESPSMEFIVAPELLNVGVLKTGVMGIYFVPTKDHLYVVFEVIEHGAVKLVVFVLDEQEWEWTHVSDIGDEVFFIGSDVSFAVSAEHLPGWKAGTICLFNRSCWNYYNRYVKASGDDMPVGAECMDAITYVKYERLFWLFDMDDQEKGIVPFEKLDDKEGYTRLFCPPPPWMKWRSASCDDVEVQLHNLTITGGSDYDDDGHGSGNVAGNEAEEVLEEVP